MVADVNVIDIIVSVLLLLAVWRGWRSGILVQLSGIVGIVLGAWLAYRFSERVGVWLEVEDGYDNFVFAAILIVVMVGVIILGKLLTKVLCYGGLSIPIKLLGAMASFIKAVIVLALILRTFEMFNTVGKVADMKYMRESVAYTPLHNIASVLFPYIVSWGERVEGGQLQQTINDEIKREVDEQVKRQIDKIKN